MLSVQGSGGTKAAIERAIAHSRRQASPLTIPVTASVEGDTLTVHVAAIASEEGFRIHPRKTRIMRQGVRQIAAGVRQRRHHHRGGSPEDGMQRHHHPLGARRRQ